MSSGLPGIMWIRANATTDTPNRIRIVCSRRAARKRAIGGSRRAAVLLDRDVGEILVPALRRHKPLHLWRQGARIEVVHDEQPRRVVDNAAMRLGQQLALL